MANENGWGDGASNNNIGWGQGAINNSISWGAIHSLSAAGLTDIVGQTFQPESVAYFTAIEDAGGTLTDNVKAEWDAFILGCKNANIYTKIKRLNAPIGGVINGAIIDAITTSSFTNSNFLNSDVDSIVGLTGDGSTKCLTDTESPSQIFDSDYSWGGYWLELTAALAAGDTFAFGAYDAANGAQWGYTRRGVSGNGRVRGNSLSVEVQSGTLLTNGDSYAYNKTSNTSTKIFYNGGNAVETTTTDTGTLSVTAMKYFAASNTGTPIGLSPAKIGGFALWSGFTDSDVATFDSLFKTFINNITA